MQEAVQENNEQLGFVCPEWAQQHWDRFECTIEPETEGGFIVLDHSKQCVIFAAKTRGECESFLGNDVPELQDPMEVLFL